MNIIKEEDQELNDNDISFRIKKSHSAFKVTPQKSMEKENRNPYGV